MHKRTGSTISTLQLSVPSTCADILQSNSQKLKQHQDARETYCSCWFSQKWEDVRGAAINTARSLPTSSRCLPTILSIGLRWNLTNPPKLLKHSFTIDGHEVCLVTWLSALPHSWEPGWRIDIKLITHHPMLIPKARLCSSNKQPAGATISPCFAPLKLIGHSMLTQLILRMTRAGVTRIVNFFLNIF